MVAAVAEAAVAVAVAVDGVAAVDGAAAVDGSVTGDGDAIVGAPEVDTAFPHGGTPTSAAIRGGTGGRLTPSTPTLSSQGIPAIATGAPTATTWIQTAPAGSAPVAK